MIKTSLSGGMYGAPRRTYVLGSTACGGCGARGGCDCDAKVREPGEVPTSAFGGEVLGR